MKIEFSQIDAKEFPVLYCTNENRKSINDPEVIQGFSEDDLKFRKPTKEETILSDAKETYLEMLSIVQYLVKSKYEPLLGNKEPIEIVDVNDLYYS